MKKSFSYQAGLLFLLLLVGGVGQALAQSGSNNGAAHAARQSKSLYQRLGGYDALAAVTDDFVGRLVSDKQLARFFGGVSNDSRKRIRQLVLDQLCAATGGPCLYIGRSMRTVHEGLGITEDDWKLAVGHLVETLDKFKVAKAERDDLFKILVPLKDDIVDKK